MEDVWGGAGEEIREIREIRNGSTENLVRTRAQSKSFSGVRSRGESLPAELRSAGGGRREGGSLVARRRLGTGGNKMETGVVGSDDNK